MTPASAARGQAWWRAVAGGTVGSVTVLALVLTLGLLAYAPLGPEGVAAGLRGGLLTAVVGGVVYALLGRARLPACAPSSATALLLAALVVQLRADPALAGTEGIVTIVALSGLAVALAGALQIVLGLLGASRLAVFVPQPVLAGFLNSVALQLVVAQWPLLVGLPLGAAVLAGAWQPLAVVAGLLAAAAVLLLVRRWPRLPASLLVLAVGSLLVAGLAPALPLSALGERVGPLPSLLPGAGAAAPPFLRWLAADDALLRLLAAHAGALLSAAVLIAGVGLLETALNGIALDRQRGTRHDPRRELVAIGATNLVLGALGGVPAVLNRVRAMAVAQAGGDGRAALAVGSLVLGAVVLAGQDLLAWLPLPVLAGLMLVVAWSLVDRWSLGLLRRCFTGRTSGPARQALLPLVPVLAVMLATLAAGLGPGVALGALLSLLIFIARMNRSLVRSRSSAQERPSRRIRPPALDARLRPLRRQVRIVALEGALFFGSGERLLVEADALPPDTAELLLDCARVSTVDESGAQLLQDLALRLRPRSVTLRIAGLRPALRDSLHGLDADFRPDLDLATEAAEEALLRAAGGAADPAAALAPAATTLLAGLDEADLALVGRHLEPLRLAAGERLFDEGEPADRLYLLLSGSVSVVSAPRPDGRRHRFLSISPGMMLGETAMLDGGGRTAAALADCDSTLLALSSGALQALQHEHPALAARLYRQISVHLSQRLRDAAGAWRDDSG